MTNDIFTTLTISVEEARNGTARSLTLPNTGSQLTIAVPAGAYDGQVLRISGGIAPIAGEQPGALLITLQVTTGVPVPLSADNSTTVAATPSLATQPASGQSRQYPPLATQPAKVSGPNWPVQGVQTVPATPSPASQSGQYPPLTPGTPLPAYASGASWQAQGAQHPLASSAPNWQYPQAAPGAAIPGRQAGRGLSTLMVVLLVLVVVIILLAGSLGGIVLLENHAQTVALSNATATTLASYSAATSTTNATATPQYATATALAQGNTSVSDPYGAGGTLLVNDPLQSNDAGKNWYWEQDSHCAFESGGYHVINTSSQYIQNCDLETTTQLVNYAVEVKMSILRGDVGGIVFRNDPIFPQDILAYMLVFDTKGNYQLLYYDINRHPNRLAEGQSSAFHTGYGQSNTIAVVAQGSTISWYANGQQAGSLNDGRYNEGGIRLTDWVYQGNSGNSETAFSNLRVWGL